MLSMSDSTDSVLSLAAQIVAAHVANNRVDPADLPKLINDVHRALANAGQSTAAPPRAEPAVDIKRSVRNDHIVCLECGKHFSMLKRHLNTDHQLTPGDTAKSGVCLRHTRLLHQTTLRQDRRS